MPVCFTASTDQRFEVIQGKSLAVHRVMLPAGRNPVQLNGWGNAAEARALISEAMKRFEK